MSAGATPFLPFHAGEREAQRRAGLAIAHAPLRAFMPDQHRLFFAHLPYLFVATLDAEGAPIATVLDGDPGFVDSPTPTRLVLSPRADERDPVRRHLTPGAPVGLLGLDLSTRRRNRANGHIADARGGSWAIEVDQSFGNCPRYIQARGILGLRPRGEAAPEELPGLDAAARGLVATASTLFVASAARVRNGGVDMSHRGGRPGFVHLEGDQLVIPDFAGNNYLNTVGNFVVDPRATLLFIDFASGDLLSISGRVTLDFSPAVRPAGAAFLWRLTPTRITRRRAAVPYVWMELEMSPVLEKTGDWPGEGLGEGPGEG